MTTRAFISVRDRVAIILHQRTNSLTTYAPSSGRTRARWDSKDIEFLIGDLGRLAVHTKTQMIEVPYKTAATFANEWEFQATDAYTNPNENNLEKTLEIARRRFSHQVWRS